MRAVWPFFIWCWIGYELYSLDGLEMTNLLVADFLLSLWIIIHFLRLHQLAGFSLVIFLVITLIHSWSDLNDQEWWKKSAKIRLNCLHGILISFLLKSFGERYVLYVDIVYVIDNFKVGSVMDIGNGFCAPPEANIVM